MDDNQIFQNWQIFKNLLLEIKRPGMDKLLQWLDDSDFKFAPASTQYHSSYRGGLLQHSLDVYYHMYDFKPLIDFFELSEETIRVTSLLHDICKVNCYVEDYRNVKNEQGNWIKVPYYKWDELEPLGHAEKSIMLIYENGVQLTKIERAMIRNHMGFSTQEKTNMVSSLFSKCPQSLVLFYADMTTTYVKESKDLQPRFKEKLVGRNIGESLNIRSQMREIIVDGMTYKLAPKDSVVDNKEIIEVNYTNPQGGKQLVKVYAPHKDGLPF